MRILREQRNSLRGRRRSALQLLPHEPFIQIPQENSLLQRGDELWLNLNASRVLSCLGNVCDDGADAEIRPEMGRSSLVDNEFMGMAGL